MSDQYLDAIQRAEKARAIPAKSEPNLKPTSIKGLSKAFRRGNIKVAFPTEDGLDEVVVELRRLIPAESFDKLQSFLSDSVGLALQDPNSKVSEADQKSLMEKYEEALGVLHDAIVPPLDENGVPEEITMDELRLWDETGIIVLMTKLSQGADIRARFPEKSNGTPEQGPDAGSL